MYVLGYQEKRAVCCDYFCPRAGANGAKKQFALKIFLDFMSPIFSSNSIHTRWALTCVNSWQRATG